MHTTPSSPVGLHRVTDPAGAALPQAARGHRPVARALARRGAHRGRDAQPRRRLVPPALREARRRRGCRARGGARHRRHPRQDAEPGHRLGRHAHRHRRRGRARVAARARGRRPGRHAGVPLADPAHHHRRPGPLGRPLRAGARAGHGGAVRPLHRRPAARRPLARPGPDGHGRLRRPGPGRPGGGGVRRARASRRPWPCSAAPASPGRCRSPRPATPVPAAASGWCRSSARPTCSRPAAWPTRSSSPTPARRSASRMPWRPPAGRPTSPSSASTCPAASSRRILATAQGGTIIYFSMATQLLGRGAGRRGPGRRRADAGRQRLRARPRRPRARPAAPHPGRAGAVRGAPRRVSSTARATDAHPLRVTHPASGGNSVEGFDSIGPRPQEARHDPLRRPHPRPCRRRRPGPAGRWVFLRRLDRHVGGQLARRECRGLRVRRRCAAASPA